MRLAKVCMTEQEAGSLVSYPLLCLSLLPACIAIPLKSRLLFLEMLTGTIVQAVTTCHTAYSYALGDSMDIANTPWIHHCHAHVHLNLVVL